MRRGSTRSTGLILTTLLLGCGSGGAGGASDAEGSGGAAQPGAGGAASGDGGALPGVGGQASTAGGGADGEAGTGGVAPGRGGELPAAGGGSGAEGGTGGAPPGVGGQVSTAGSGADGGTGTGGVAPGSGGELPAAGGGSGGGCQAPAVPAALAPLNIVFLIDKSASMGAQDTNGDGDHDDTTEWDNRATRWDPVTAALIAFLENPGAEGLHATLGFFPVGDIPTAPDTGICSREQYENPAVPLQSLDDPAAVELLVAQIEGITPSGGTPTLPALEGAIEVARRARAENPGSSSAVVMVTDGLPAIARVVDGAVYAEKCFCYGEPGCPDQDEIPYVAQAAQMGAADGIPTFVIGMGDVGFDPLHTIAAAGDTGQAYIVDADDPSMTQERLAAAFGSVRSVQAPCDLALPVAPEGEAFDRLLVNLELVSSGGLVQPIHYAGSLVTQLGGDQLTCPDPGPPAPADPWFWTYDDEDDPTRILLCASACGQIDGDAAGGIYVAYGCPTAVASAP